MKGLFVMLALAAMGSAQSTTNDIQTPPTATKTEKKAKPGAGKDLGGGSADIGKGAAKGAGNVAKGTGNVAKGTGKGAVDLVTLHPVAGAESIGSGAVSAGKDVTVGTAKGAGKITRGVGKLFKKIF